MATVSAICYLVLSPLLACTYYFVCDLATKMMMMMIDDTSETYRL